MAIKNQQLKPILRKKIIIIMSRARSKKSWSKVVGSDLKTLSLVEDMTYDRKLWRSRIKIADFREFVTRLPFGSTGRINCLFVRLSIIYHEILLFDLSCMY